MPTSEPEGPCRILIDFLNSLDEISDDPPPSSIQPAIAACLAEQESGDTDLPLLENAFSLIFDIRSLICRANLCDSPLPADRANTDLLLPELTLPRLIENLNSLRDFVFTFTHQLHDKLQVHLAEHNELVVLRAECSRRYHYIQRFQESASKLSSLECRNADLHEQLNRQRTSHGDSIRDLEARLSAALADAQSLRNRLSLSQQQAARCAGLEADLQDAQVRCADLQAQLSEVCLELERYYLLTAEVLPASASPELTTESAYPSLIAEREEAVINHNRSRLLNSV